MVTQQQVLEALSKVKEPELGRSLVSLGMVQDLKIDGGAVRIWALVAGAMFVSAAVVVPVVLRPLNRLWFVLGMALHKVVNPLVMGFLFYLTVTPMALLMRLAGKDPLRLKFDRQAKSYWIKRQPAGPAPESMRHQF